MMRLVCAVILASACAACSKDAALAPPNLGSPRSVADGYLKAMADPTGAAVVPLLPSEEILAKTFACPNGEMAKALQALKPGKDGARPGGPAAADVVLAIGEFDVQGTDEKIYKLGEEYAGCKVKASVTVHRSKLVINMTRGAKTDFDSQVWTFFKFGIDESWYFLRL